ncbi:MAG TPA: Gfo/Idh/MocA family oxidoreductase [Ignavibacteriales bacterium]|nr:Gfo/Idh/MocA family oxidoreductase [Ignavibacteriales bacterium]
MKKINLGIIGTGLAARHLHYPALQKLSDKFEIALVCNHTEPKVKSFSKLTGGTPYTLNYMDVLNSPDIDAVSIALPIELNYKVAKDAMKAGKHVILEKPLAANLAEASSLVKLASGYKKVFMVAENFRYRKVFQSAKAHVKKEDIGKVYSFIWNSLANVDVNNNMWAQTKWRQKHKYAGGFITDGGVHFAAALRLLVGDISEGSVFAGSVNKRIGEQDTFSLQFTTKSGVNGLLNLYYSVKGYYEDKLLILGTKGAIEISNNMLKLNVEGKKERIETWEEDNGYYEEFLDFYNAIVKKSKTASPAKEAYKDLEIMLRGLQAGEQGKRFKIN